LDHDGAVGDLAGLRTLTCPYLACCLLRNVSGLALAVAGLTVSYGVTAAAEPRSSFYVLATLVPMALIVSLLPCQPQDPNSLAGDIGNRKRS